LEIKINQEEEKEDKKEVAYAEIPSSAQASVYLPKVQDEHVDKDVNPCVEGNKFQMWIKMTKANAGNEDTNITSDIVIEEDNKDVETVIEIIEIEIDQEEEEHKKGGNKEHMTLVASEGLSSNEEVETISEIDATKNQGVGEDSNEKIETERVGEKEEEEKIAQPIDVEVHTSDEETNTISEIAIEEDKDVETANEILEIKINQEEEKEDKKEVAYAEIPSSAQASVYLPKVQDKHVDKDVNPYVEGNKFQMWIKMTKAHASNEDTNITSDIVIEEDNKDVETVIEIIEIEIDQEEEEHKKGGNKEHMTLVASEALYGNEEVETISKIDATKNQEVGQDSNEQIEIERVGKKEEEEEKIAQPIVEEVHASNEETNTISEIAIAENKDVENAIEIMVIKIDQNNRECNEENMILLASEALYGNEEVETISEIDATKNEEVGEDSNQQIEIERVGKKKEDKVAEEVHPSNEETNAISNTAIEENKDVETPNEIMEIKIDQEEEEHKKEGNEEHMNLVASEVPSSNEEVETISEIDVKKNEEVGEDSNEKIETERVGEEEEKKFAQAIDEEAQTDNEETNTISEIAIEEEKDAETANEIMEIKIDQDNIEVNEEGDADGEDSGSESDSSDGSSDDEGFGEEGWVDKKGKKISIYMYISIYVYVLVHIHIS
jgi:hypothetical protein